ALSTFRPSVPLLTFGSLGEAYACCLVQVGPRISEIDRRSGVLHHLSVGDVHEMLAIDSPHLDGWGVELDGPDLGDERLQTLVLLPDDRLPLVTIPNRLGDPVPPLLQPE